MSRGPGWVKDYVGLPWRVHGRDRDGVDCWGLLRLVLAERFGLDLPSYAEGYASAGRADVEDLAALIRGGMAPWRLVASGAEAVGTPARTGDGILLRISGQPAHVGLVTAPGWMLHVEEGAGAVLESYRGLTWRRRVLGIYRHEAMT